MDRRDWLKISGLLAGGLCAMPVLGDPHLILNIPGSGFGYFPSDVHNKILSENPEIRVRLMSNENHYGPSEKAKKEIRESIATAYQYPWTYYREFIEKIADFEGLSADHIIPSSGSSELLSTIAACFMSNGGEVVSAFPTFWSMPEHAVRFGAKWVKIPLRDDHSHDFTTMKKAINLHTRLVYLVNPNNPTGTISSAHEIEEFCREVAPKVPVVVDEAYFDYLPASDRPDLISLIKEGLPVIVVRTFSKIYGFAGLRIGYCMAPPEMIKKLELFKGSGTITGPSIKAAIATYEDQDFKSMVLRKNDESKKFLYRTLENKGYSYLPSYTNFVFVPLDKDGEDFRKKLLEKGVAIRAWELGEQHYLRISLGTLEDMKIFKQAFDYIA